MTTTSFRLDKDLEGKLDDVAQSLRRSKSWIINDALRHYIEREERRRRMLRETEEAIADLEAGRIVSGDAVMSWLESWGTELETDVSSNAGMVSYSPQAAKRQTQSRRNL